MNGVAIEKWNWLVRKDVFDWLEQNYGSSNKNTWYTDKDYDFEDLVMKDEIYFMFMLRWS